MYSVLPERENLAAGPGDGEGSVRLTDDGSVASGRPSRISAHLAETADVEPDPAQVEAALEDLETAVAGVRSTGDGRYYRDERVTPTRR